MSTIIRRGGIGDAGGAILGGILLGLVAAAAFHAAPDAPSPAAAVGAAASPTATPSPTSTPKATPKTERYCAKSHTVHHDAYTQEFLIFVGKAPIMFPIRHAATDETVCDAYATREVKA